MGSMIEPSRFFLAIEETMDEISRAFGIDLEMLFNIILLFAIIDGITILLMWATSTKKRR